MLEPQGGSQQISNDYFNRATWHEYVLYNSRRCYLHSPQPAQLFTASLRDGGDGEMDPERGKKQNCFDYWVFVIFQIQE